MNSLDFNENNAIREASIGEIFQQIHHNLEENKTLETSKKIIDDFNTYISMHNHSSDNSRAQLIQKEEFGQGLLLQIKEISRILGTFGSDISIEILGSLVEKLNNGNFGNEEIARKSILFMEILKKLKSQSDKYDENFTLILDLKTDESYRNESLMLPILLSHKESDFITLFKAFRPFLFDLLKRREGFEDFTQNLRRLAKREKIVSQDIIKQLEVKDILFLLIESCSQASLAQLGFLISSQFYPLPLIPLPGQNEYQFSFECFFGYMFQTGKSLVTSIGTKSAMGLGKSSFLSDLFSIKHPNNFSTKNGFAHFGAVDLYVNLPSTQHNYIIADIQSYRKDKEFLNLISGVLAASEIILVHITEEDIAPQNGYVNLNFKVNNNKSKVIYLWRDYDDDHFIHSDLKDKLENNIENIGTVLGLICIPKLNDEQNLDVQNDKIEAMQGIFEKINALRLQKSMPLLDLFKSLEVHETLDLHSSNQLTSIDFDKEAEEVTNLLHQEIERAYDRDLKESLFPCLSLDSKIIEAKKKKNLLRQTKKEFIYISETYHEIQDIIKKCKKLKSEIQVSSLIQKVMDIISSNELSRILLFSEVIHNEQKRVLENDVKNQDLSLTSFLEEILSYYEPSPKTPQYMGIKKYIFSCLMQGVPLSLINGNTMKFGNELLQDVFDKELEDMRNVFVISVISAPGYGKRTLLNALFGFGFKSSAGKRMRGVYIYLLHHPSGFKIIIIDTEGLLSTTARDYEFDNLIAKMVFSCAHLVIINNKVEIKSRFKDLLEVCVHAMNHLQLTSIKPKIIFALRDILDNKTETQQEMLLAMKSSLEQAANKLSVNISQMIDFSQEDIFLLPPAFQLPAARNTNTQDHNNLFSASVLEMRHSIFNFLTSNPLNPVSCPSFFYHQSEQLWNDISGLNSDSVIDKSCLEAELKDKALDSVHAICQNYNENLLESGQKLIEYHKAELKKAEFHSTAAFFQAFATELNRIKDTANTEVDNKIFRNEKYAIISCYFNEFREIVEYNLRRQKQSFVSDWNASISSWETNKEIKKFKTEIKKKVNEKIKNVSLDNLTAEIITYFEDLTHKLQIEFDKNMDKLRANITDNLPGEIHTHFDSAQKTLNCLRTNCRILIPPLSLILDRIKGHTSGAYDPKIFEKHQRKCGRGNAKGEIIMSEFRSFVGDLHRIITGESNHETALKVIQDCLARIEKLKNDELSVDSATFMYYGLVEGMYQQYNKAFEIEINKTQQKAKEYENAMKKEEQHIRDLLEDSLNSWAQGVRCAKHWFKEIKGAFCVNQEILIQEALMKKIREEFPKPESANKKAYELSFSARNFENCLKYTLNINKFIQEIYEERMNVLSETEIEKNLELQADTFMSLIKRIIQSVREWEADQNEDSNKIQLSTLISYIDKNEGLKIYFPNLYDITLGDIKTFTCGCIDELSKEIQKNTLKEDLKVIIAQKINQHLKGQYQDLTGCQERCPMCNNKCTKADRIHKDHHTDYHLLSAFCGSRNKQSKEILLQCCFDPKHHQSTWFVGDKEFKSYDEMIEKQYPTWRQEFPRKYQPDKLKADIAPELMECWVGIKDVLTSYYGCKENTPKAWLDLVEPSRRLKADTYLEGYMDPVKAIHLSSNSYKITLSLSKEIAILKGDLI